MRGGENAGKNSPSTRFAIKLTRRRCSSLQMKQKFEFRWQKAVAGDDFCQRISSELFTFSYLRERAFHRRCCLTDPRGSVGGRNLNSSFLVNSRSARKAFAVKRSRLQEEE